jgi:RNA ligase (TIGR02306 family)
LFKEVYGSKIQHLAYGLEGQVADAAFDLSLDGQYMDHDAFVALCDRHGVPVVPHLYRGPFDRAKLDAIVNGPGVKTVVGQGKHILEGVVLKPARERWNIYTGRTILKWISDAYALDKDATDFH